MLSGMENPIRKSRDRQTRSPGSQSKARHFGSMLSKRLITKCATATTLEAVYVGVQNLTQNN